MINVLLITISSLTFSYNGWFEQVIQIIEPKHKTVAVVLVTEPNKEYDINSMLNRHISRLFIQQNGTSEIGMIFALYIV